MFTVKWQNTLGLIIFGALDTWHLRNLNAKILFALSSFIKEQVQGKTTIHICILSQRRLRLPFSAVPVLCGWPSFSHNTCLCFSIFYPLGMFLSWLCLLYLSWLWPQVEILCNIFRLAFLLSTSSPLFLPACVIEMLSLFFSQITTRQRWKTISG